MCKNISLLLLLWFLMLLEGRAQSLGGLAGLEENYYIVVEDLPNTQDVYMTDTIPGSQIQILAYNIFFDDKNDSRRYLLVISVLPDPNNITPTFSEVGMAKGKVMRNRIDYPELKKRVVASFRDMMVAPDIVDTDMLRTDRLIPVVYGEETKEYISYENKVISECFIVEDNPPSFRSDNLSNEDFRYLLEQVVPYYQPANINLKAPIIPKSVRNHLNLKIEKGLAIANDNPVPDTATLNSFQTYFSDRILIEDMVNDSVYHLYYQPAVKYDGNPRGYPLTDIYYHPHRGVVGASYQSYFEEFYNWIPKVASLQKVIYSVKNLNSP